MKTKFFGEIDVNVDNEYLFEKGIPGFESCKRFVLIQEDDSSFYYLQSVDEAELCFIMLSPWGFKETYRLEKLDVIAEILGETKDLEVYVIANMGRGLQDSFVNMQGPILLNPDTKKGTQWIVEDSKYTTRTPLIEVFK